MAKTPRKTSTPRTNILTMPRQDSGSAAEPGDVAQRAYEIFLARGAAHGADVDDWLRAEQELAAAVSAPKMKRAARTKSA